MEAMAANWVTEADLAKEVGDWVEEVTAPGQTAAVRSSAANILHRSLQQLGQGC
jgi:hypothetical protein